MAKSVFLHTDEPQLFFNFRNGSRLNILLVMLVENLKLALIRGISFMRSHTFLSNSTLLHGKVPIEVTDLPISDVEMCELPIRPRNYLEFDNLFQKPTDVLLVLHASSVIDDVERDLLLVLHGQDQAVQDLMLDVLVCVMSMQLIGKYIAWN